MVLQQDKQKFSRRKSNMKFPGKSYPGQNTCIPAFLGTARTRLDVVPVSKLSRIIFRGIDEDHLKVDRFVPVLCFR